MKRLLLLLLLALLLGPLYGQMLNGSFESWNSTPYDEPVGFQTGNKESISLGLTPITKVNGNSGFAVRMETLASNGDTAMAYIANGDPMNGEGGIPFAEQPTAITGYYRYNLQGNDTALLLVIFKKNGNIISSDVFKIRGTGVQNTFVGFSYPLSLPMAPDSVILAATSSNLLDNVGVAAGSWMELDGLAFSGVTAQVPNGNFETWVTNSNDAIDGWESYGDGIAKTNDSYDGAWAISLMTNDYGGGQIGSSGITNGHNTNNGPSGGIPYNYTIDTLTGYYKYITANNDSAPINLSFSANGNYISWAGLLLPAAAQYTYFEIPIYCNSSPDTMRIDISSSKWPYTPQSVGSQLFIDNLQLKSDFAAGVSEKIKSVLAIAYPNPSNDVLNFRLNENVIGNLLIEIYDMSGRLLINESKAIEDGKATLSIANLASGRYYYKISTPFYKYQQMFSKQ